MKIYKFYDWNLTDDEDILAPLSFLRQREIVHYARFKELFEYYEKNDKEKDTMYYKNNNEFLTQQLNMMNSNYYM